MDDDPALYRFTDGEIDQILNLAGVAAHEGGHKTNAPLPTSWVSPTHN